MILKVILCMSLVFLDIGSFLNTEYECTFPFTYIEGAGSCFYFEYNSTEKVTWIAAKEACNRYGAHLAVLDTEEKNNSVVNFLTTGPVGLELKFNDKLWIGLYDQYHENSYFWDGTGQLSTFKDYYADKLSSRPVDHCVAIQPRLNWKLWDILECDTNNNGFICEKPLHNATPTLLRCEDIDGFESVENAGCLHFHYSSTHNWLEAKEYCERKNGRLVIMEREEIFLAIQQHLWYSLHPKYQAYTFWIGLYDTSHKDKWYWNGLGIETNYSGFAIGEPSGGVAHNCVYLNSHTSPTYGWTDSKCDKERNYICEIPSVHLIKTTPTTYVTIPTTRRYTSPSGSTRPTTTARYSSLRPPAGYGGNIKHSGYASNGTARYKNHRTTSGYESHRTTARYTSHGPPAGYGGNRTHPGYASNGTAGYESHRPTVAYASNRT